MRYWAGAAAVLVMAMAVPGAVTAARLTPQRVFADPDLSGPRARTVKIAPDGSAVAFLRAKPDDQRTTDLWIAPIDGSAPRMLIDGRALTPRGAVLSADEKSRRERQGIQSHGVVDYSWDDTGDRILAPVEGDLWLYDRPSGKLSKLTDKPADDVDARLSPKGHFVSYVRGGNLYVRPASGGPERALTQGGGELKSWATAEFVAQEELARETGYWWSDDETRIALTHVDETGVDVVPRFDIGPDGAEVVNQRYPKAGRPNAVVELHVEDVASGARVKVDLGPNPDIYLARVDWAKDGRTLYVQRLSRDQKRLDLLAADPATGATRILLSQTSPHWVELSKDFRPLKDGSFLWSSEASGDRHIYHYAADGSLIRQVTAGDWPVADLLGVDEARGLVFFLAGKETPTERRIYEVSYLSPGEARAITSAGGWWSGDFARVGGAFVATYEDPKTPPRTGLYREDGTLAAWIEENRLGPGHPFWPYADRLPTPTYGTLEAADGEDLWWQMRTPPGFDPKKRYPVIVEVYGGPAGQMVRHAWANPTDQLWLEAGYILFSLDNRGTPGRSVRFKTALDRHFGSVEVEDQLAGASWLKSLPYVDPGRLGVVGWSNGGFMTLMLLTAPDSPFAAGIAGAPVTDWTLYDTGYTERYMGTPRDNPSGYAAADVVPRLKALRPGVLMLIHGMADDNVSFVNSTRVMFALQGEGTPFETMVYPGLRHRAGWTQKDLLHRMLTELDFFDRKLNPTPAP
ncbi:MAG TPA: S9 family peptidase [Caulobacteraceae bacterium]|jgi:dipeptidyl-peptidase-4